MSTKKTKTWASCKTLTIVAITTSNNSCSRRISPHFMTQIMAPTTMQHLETKSIKISLRDMIHWAVTTTRPIPSNQISNNIPAFTLHVAITDTRGQQKTRRQPPWWASMPTTRVTTSCSRPSTSSPILSINSSSNSMRKDPITQDKSLSRAHRWLHSRNKRSKTTMNSTNASGRIRQATAIPTNLSKTKWWACNSPISSNSNSSSSNILGKMGLGGKVIAPQWVATPMASSTQSQTSAQTNSNNSRCFRATRAIHPTPNTTPT